MHGPGLMLSAFCAWWAAQMRALPPESLRSPAGRPDALIIAMEDLNGSGSLLMRRKGRETKLAPLPSLSNAKPPRQGLPVFLRLPDGMVLSRDVSLPLAAARDMHTAIGFEMDRLTPFSAGELSWGIGAVTPGHAPGRLQLRLAIVPRAPLSPLLASLAERGLAPSRIETRDGQHIPLATGRITGQGLFRRHGWSMLCALLAAFCLVSPFLRQQAALSATRSMVAAHSQAAHRAEALRRQLAIAHSSREVIAKARRGGDALRLLAVLTDTLPDGTWLNDLSLKGQDLNIDGQSSDAAKLIARLAAVPALKDPSFTAPVTRSADGKRDQFSIHAKLAG
ncbi:PilN domain-containing protein [Acidocella sp.]|uniref:PilN domain-containing protein n=1 Tax=Acidocella sp. TaxID=50710 RepID=UPI003CFD3B33